MWNGVLSGINEQRQANNQNSLSNLAQLKGIEDLGATTDQRQREAKFRADLGALGPDASSDKILQLAINSGVVPAKDLMTTLQGAENKKLQIDATKEMARSRLAQTAALHDRDYELKMKQATTAEQRAAVDAWDKQVRQGLTAEHLRMTGEVNNYNTGAGLFKPPNMTPPPMGGAPAGGGATISPTVTPAEVMAIQDPQERAAAMAAMQGGRFSGPPSGAAPSPVPAPANMSLSALSAPPAAPMPANAPPMGNLGSIGAPPVAAPAAPEMGPNEDMRDVMARRARAATPPPVSALQAGAVPTAAVTAPPAALAQLAGAPKAPDVKTPLTMDDAPAGLSPRDRSRWLLNQSKPKGPDGAGGRESVQIQRVIMAGNQAAHDLENIAKLPLTSSTGIFGGRGQEQGIFNAGKETLTNKATTQEVQSYETLSAGFQRSLAAIEAAGLMPSGTLTHQMDAVIFKEGNTNFTKLQKLAQIRQIIDAGLETIAANPRVPAETKEHLQEVRDRTAKAVPFTQDDLIELQKRQKIDPKITLADVIGKVKDNAPATDVPAGIDPKVWKVMTPQEKALWK